jgi:hypothetical protein
MAHVKQQESQATTGIKVIFNDQHAFRDGKSLRATRGDMRTWLSGIADPTAPRSLHKAAVNHCDTVV